MSPPIPVGSGMLQLLVNSSAVGNPQPPSRVTTDQNVAQLLAIQLPSANTSNFIRLLTGKLSNFTHYARKEQTQWLMDVAADICDPRMARGSLFILDQSGWEPVVATAPLQATFYCYMLPPGTILALTKISTRLGKSNPETTGRAGIMRDRVLQRDHHECWITQITEPLVNSYICPKRMGDALARHILANFCPNFIQPPGLTVNNPIFGITLCRTQDVPFDNYQLGFRFISNDLYEVHVFATPVQQGNVFTHAGEVPPHRVHPTFNPPVHGSQVSPPRPSETDNPPPGLFRWHYVQCVIAKFGHADYRGLANIEYPELHLPMEGDSDDEGTDSDCQWPTAARDRGRALAETRQELGETTRRRCSVIQHKVRLWFMPLGRCHSNLEQGG